MGIFDFFINSEAWPPFIKKTLFILSVCWGIFLFFRKGRVLGFNPDKLLDLAIYPLLASLVVFYSLKGFGNYNFGLSLLSFMFIFSYLTGRCGWSYQRLSDIAALATLGGLVFFPLPSLFLNLYFLILFLATHKIYRHNPRGGLISYLFLILFSTPFVFDLALKGRLFTFNVLLMLALTVAALVRLRTGGYLESLIGAVVFLKANKIMKTISEYLDRSFVGKMKNLLKDKKAQLHEEEQKLISEDLFFDSGRVTGNSEEQDEALEQTEHERIWTEVEGIRESQKDIELALRKIEEGSYGKCGNCGKDIGRARLEAYPEARYCLNCSRE